jgi:4-amino-4-deoxy-L-arabinose transferase-like glycosyltransferase
MTTADRFPSTRWILACALLYAVLTLAFLGDRPIKRVQEARVLETSRQMLESPDWHGWLVPYLNGEPRLRKPPFCYWYTAAAFSVLGVSEWAGRLPALALGWGCVVVTFFFGRDLLGHRGGFLAAAVLASSNFFIRFIRSDETDIPAMLGVILACWAIARGVGIKSTSTSAEVEKGHWAWFHLAGIGIALSCMSKGAPAIFPLVFVGLLCWAMRSKKPAVRFLLSGAPITALALIAPWFVYALKDPAARQVGEEIIVVTSGSNHRGIFINYIPTILHMLIPWTPVLVAAFFMKKLRRPPIDLPGRVAVCALMGVLLPLCVTLNVQAHYLIPSLPGFALVMAWTITRALEAVESPGRSPAGERAAGLLELSWGIAVWVGLITGPLILIAELIRRRPITGNDFAAAASLMFAGAVLWTLGRGQKPAAQVVLWATLMIMAMPIVGGWWAPNFNPDHGRQVAAAINNRIGDRPLIGWGVLGDVTLSFNMRRAIPWLVDESKLRDRIERQPNAVVVTQRDERGGTPVPQIGLHKSFEHEVDGDILEFYERSGPSTLPATQP